MCVCVFLSFRGVSFSAGLNLFLWLCHRCAVCVWICRFDRLCETECMLVSCSDVFGACLWSFELNVGQCVCVCGCTFVSLYFASFVEYILGENAGRHTLPLRTPVSPFATVIWLCTPWNRGLDSEKCSVRLKSVHLLRWLDYVHHETGVWTAKSALFMARNVSLFCCPVDIACQTWTCIQWPMCLVWP